MFIYHTNEAKNTQNDCFLLFCTVTGANIYIISAIVCAVCVFYTYIGGIKVRQIQEI